MPLNYFEGRTEAWLLSERSAIQEEIARGSVASSSGAEASMSYEQREAATERLKRVMYALYLLDTATYTNPYTAEVTRTKARFTFSS